VATASAHTLYAHWTANQYTVSFDANLNGVVAPADKPVIYNQPYGALDSLSKE
jgi:hypothetical protein